MLFCLSSFFPFIWNFSQFLKIKISLKKKVVFLLNILANTKNNKAKKIIKL